MSDIQRYSVIETALCIGGNVLDGEVSMVRASEHDAALAALREDLADARLCRSVAEGEWMEALTAAEQRNAELEKALKFYGDGDHLLLADPGEWDTCSGEPINWLHDAAGTASVEDGSLAKQVLAKPTESGASE